MVVGGTCQSTGGSVAVVALGEEGIVVIGTHTCLCKWKCILLGKAGNTVFFATCTPGNCTTDHATILLDRREGKGSGPSWACVGWSCCLSTTPFRGWIITTITTTTVDRGRCVFVATCMPGNSTILLARQDREKRSGTSCPGIGLFCHLSTTLSRGWTIT